HSVRIAANLVVAPITELSEREQLLDPRARVAVVVGGEQAQVSPRRQVWVEGRPLDEAGDTFERLRPGDLRIAPEKLDRALGRPDQPEQHPQRGRLAGAVRPEVAEDVSLLDRQVDVVDGDELAVQLDEPARANRECIAHPSARAAASAAAGGTAPARTDA